MDVFVVSCLFVYVYVSASENITILSSPAVVAESCSCSKNVGQQVEITWHYQADDIV